MLKILVKVFKRLYLLNLWMEVVLSCPDVRYWSEVSESEYFTGDTSVHSPVLNCTISTHISDLEVKVAGLEKK